MISFLIVSRKILMRWLMTNDDVIDDVEELEEKLAEEEKESPKSLQQKNIEDLKEYHETRDEDLRNEIVTNNIRMVYRIAQGYCKKWHVPMEDLVQEGCMGLLSAVENFEPKYNVMFSTFAFPYIRTAMSKYIQQVRHIISIPTNIQQKINRLSETIDKLTQKLDRIPTDQEIADSMGVSLSEVLDLKTYGNSVISSDTKDDGDSDSKVAIQDYYPDENEDPSRLAKQKETYEVFLEALDSLGEKKKDIYKRRHGIDCEKETLQEISKTYGISLQRIAQLETEAEKDIKKKLKDFLD